MITPFFDVETDKKITEIINESQYTQMFRKMRKTVSTNRVIRREM